MIAVVHLAVGNASVTEMLWTLTGLVGVYLNARNGRDARRELQAIKMMNGGNLARAEAMKVVAFGHYRNELLRAAISAIIVMVGVLAMLTPPAIPSTPVTPVQILVTVGFFAIEIITVVASALDRRQRLLLLG